MKHLFKKKRSVVHGFGSSIASGSRPQFTGSEALPETAPHKEITAKDLMRGAKRGRRKLRFD